VKVEYVEESSVRKALVFEIDAEVVSAEIEAKTKEMARKVRLPGFRPGRIPDAVVKQRFHSEVFSDAAEAIVNRVVFTEIEGRGLQPLAPPRVADLVIEESQPMTFRALFETLPVIDVPDYRGLAVKAKRAVVEDADLEAEIARLREEAARFDPVEGRPTEVGDFINVDLTWKPVNGGRGGRDENAVIEVGGEGNHEEMNRTIVGMTVGETREATLAYPDDHKAPALAGKSVRYALTLKAVKQKMLPALDDEFAKDLGEWESLAALRASIGERLQAAAERRADRETRSALVDVLVDAASFEVPEALVERHMSGRTENAVRTLALQGIDPSHTGIDWRQFRENQREAATRAARADILLDEIARREGIEALDGEVQGEIVRIAERARRSPDAVRAQMEKDGDTAALRARIREDKTLDLIKSSARIETE